MSPHLTGLYKDPNLVSPVWLEEADRDGGKKLFQVNTTVCQCTVCLTSANRLSLIPALYHVANKTVGYRNEWEKTCLRSCSWGMMELELKFRPRSFYSTSAARGHLGRVSSFHSYLKGL